MRTAHTHHEDTSSDSAFAALGDEQSGEEKRVILHITRA